MAVMIAVSCCLRKEVRNYDIMDLYGILKYSSGVLVVVV